MLNEIKFKKTSEMLGGLKNKLVGSNKSKANLSIIDRLKKYFLEYARDIVEVKLEDLNNEQIELQNSINAYKNDLDEATNHDNNDENINTVKKELKKEEALQKSNKIKLDIYNTILDDKIQNKLKSIDELDAEIDAQKAEANKTNAFLDTISKNLEETADELANESHEVNMSTNANVEPVIANNEDKKTIEVKEENSTKNTVEQPNAEKEPEIDNASLAKDKINGVKDSMIELVNGLTGNFSAELKDSINKTTDGLITSITALVQDISVAYEQKLDSQATSYEERLANQDKAHNEKLDTMLHESEKALLNAENVSKAKDNKINELSSKNNTLTANLETANNTIAEKNKEISGLNEQVISLNSSIEANKLEMDAKDKEIARLKDIEAKYMKISQAFSLVTQNVPIASEEATKTR